jgi:hypothetical protein
MAAQFNQFDDSPALRAWKLESDFGLIEQDEDGNPLWSRLVETTYRQPWLSEQSLGPSRGIHRRQTRVAAHGHRQGTMGGLA